MKKITFVILFLFSLSAAVFSQVEDEYGTGLIFDDAAYEQVPKKATLTRSLYGSLPSKASLKKYCPAPLSQGSYGTCVGWSTAFCAFTIVEAMSNNWTKTQIDANTYSPGFVYNQIKSSSDVNCKYGSSISDALDLMKTKGVPKKKDMEESCPSSIPYSVFNKAANYKIKDYAKLFDNYSNQHTKIQSVKKSLSEGKPVVIGMKCPDSFNKPKGYWVPTENPNNNYGGHAMCVIGYDDSKYGGAFEIQNSWGNWWGNGGYIWIKYDDFEDWVKYAYEMIHFAKKNVVIEEEYNQFAGALRFVQSTGYDMKASYKSTHYKMNKPYKSGTKFRIYISNNEPAFVYAFGTDATLKVFPVFPHSPKISAALNYKKNDVAIPDEDHFIEMDNTVGTDYLCVLYSLNPLNIGDIHRKVESAYGSDFYAKIKSAMGGKLVNKKDIKFSYNNVSFSAKSKDKSVVAILVETKHIE